MLRTAYSLKAFREEIEEAEKLLPYCQDYVAGFHGAKEEKLPYCTTNVYIYIEKLKKKQAEYIEEVLVPRGLEC